MQSRPCFFFLQETYSIAATENQWRNEWGAEMISCHGSSNSRGVAILFKNGIDCTINHKIVDLAWMGDTLL